MKPNTKNDMSMTVHLKTYGFDAFDSQEKNLKIQIRALERKRDRFTKLAAQRATIYGNDEKTMQYAFYAELAEIDRKEVVDFLASSVSLSHNIKYRKERDV